MHDYDSILGTYVFDGETAHSSFVINKMLYSFNHEHNSQEYADDAEAYAVKYGLSDEQKRHF